MKISVIMQSFLGDYPGSRAHPEYKFVRAVGSFLTQQHEDKELIIVSDDCHKTEKLYKMLYSHLPQVKFRKVGRGADCQSMYTINEDEAGVVTKYRGQARRLGCSMATGDIITYMDSDDVILSHRLSDLATDWSDKKDDITHASNPLRWIPASAAGQWPSRIIKIKSRDLTPYFDRYQVRDRDFVLDMAVEPGRILCATYALSHRRNIDAIWEDTELRRDKDGKVISGTSEDVHFYDKLKKTGRGFRQESDSYVVCHWRGLWDL